MKIAIISDTHDNLATLKKFLDYNQNEPSQILVHCGDIAEGDTLASIACGFTGSILAAFGNMDYRDSVRDAAKKFPDKITLFEDFGQTDIGGLKIGFCHHRETALAHAKKEKYDYLFYGHTHKPWKEEIENCILANPGTLAGMFYRPTFALLDTATKKLDLKIVDRL